MRHIENQRATVSNLIIIVASAITGFIVQKSLIIDIFALTVFLVVLGIFGAIWSLKLYERHQFCQTRLNHIYKRIDKLTNIRIQELREISDTEHRKKFRKMAKLRLHYLWRGLHIWILLIGCIFTLIILIF